MGKRGTSLKIKKKYKQERQKEELSNMQLLHFPLSTLNAEIRQLTVKKGTNVDDEIKKRIESVCGKGNLDHLDFGGFTEKFLNF